MRSLEQLREERGKLIRSNLPSSEFCKRMNLLVDEIRVYDPDEPYWVYEKVDFSKWNQEGYYTL